MTIYRSAISIASVIATAGIAMLANAAASARYAMNSAPSKPKRSTASMSSARGYSSGPGWSHAQVQRQAKKRRNQRRHKATCRRARGFTAVECLIAVAIVALMALWIAGTVRAGQPELVIPTDSELRCVYGFQYLVDDHGQAAQVLDSAGRAVLCRPA